MNTRRNDTSQRSVRMPRKPGPSHATWAAIARAGPTGSDAALSRPAAVLQQSQATPRLLMPTATPLDA